MKDSAIKFGKSGLSACIGALLLGLAVPAAVAGPAEDHQKALGMWEIGNVRDAMVMWKKLAEDGYAPAQVWLGDMFDQSEENEASIDWYRKAADQGDAGGEHGLGMMYAKGEGITQDFAEALKYITRAAEKNYPKSVVLLAEVYKNGGLGLAPDPEKAALWEPKAAEFLPKVDPALAKKNEKKKRR